MQLRVLRVPVVLELHLDACGLECGHVAQEPIGKLSRREPVQDHAICYSCAHEWPPDLEVARAVISEQTPEILRGLLGQIEARLASAGARR